VVLRACRLAASALENSTSTDIVSPERLETLLKSMLPAKTSAQPMTVEAAISNFLISVPPFLGKARLDVLEVCSRSFRHT
jgi:hypothetical protein